MQKKGVSEDIPFSMFAQYVHILRQSYFLPDCRQGIERHNLDEGLIALNGVNVL